MLSVGWFSDAVIEEVVCKKICLLSLVWLSFSLVVRAVCDPAAVGGVVDAPKFNQTGEIAGDGLSISPREIWLGR